MKWFDSFLTKRSFAVTVNRTVAMDKLHHSRRFPVATCYKLAQSENVHLPVIKQYENGIQIGRISLQTVASAWQFSLLIVANSFPIRFDNVLCTKTFPAATVELQLKIFD